MLHFITCCKLVAHLVWYEIFKWLGLVIVMPPNPFYLFDCVSEAAKNKKVRDGFCLVWHTDTVIWSLWRARNYWQSFTDLTAELKIIRITFPYLRKQRIY
jgi:hypothetical protein